MGKLNICLRNQELLCRKRWNEIYKRYVDFSVNNGLLEAIETFKKKED